MRNLNLLFTIGMLFTWLGVMAQPDAQLAEAGKCYSKCKIPEVYETITERVLIKEASSKVSIKPAVYQPATEEILAKEAATALRARAAQFETATEQKLAREAATRITITPARFETATERLVSKEAPRAIAGDLVAGNMGEIGTLSTSPARFETVSEQVLVKEAYKVLKVVPAVFEKVTERKLVQAASTRLEKVPATYENVTERVLVRPAYTELSVIPAEYETVTERVLAKEAYSQISTAPATYAEASERRLVREAGTRIERIPAEFENVVERIKTADASERWEWVKLDQSCLSINPEECLTWCLVETPAQYREVTRKVRKACPTGYSASGDDCIRTVEVPATYETVSYQKLTSPAASNKVQVPAEYTTRTYRKLKAAARTVAKQIPAQYENRTYQKLVTPAYTKTIEVPARYETITMEKLVTPSTTVVEEIPAVYRTRTYQQLASPAKAEIVPCGKSSLLNINFETASAVLTQSSFVEIKRLEELLKSKPAVTAKLVGHTDDVGSAASNKSLSQSRAKAVYDALIASGINASRLSYEGMGEEQPIATNATASGRSQNRRTEFITYGETATADCNVYETRSFQKLIADATPVTTEIPAEYETYSYQKLASDAAVSETEIPAQYKSRTYQKLVSPATTASTDIPAEYREISIRKLVKPGGFSEFREVVCQADATPELYRKIQQALVDRGYNIGAAGVDGTFGATSKSALVQFQRDNNLPIGAINIETLEALGVKR